MMERVHTRLGKLCLEPVGCILLVTTTVSATNHTANPTPIITLVVAPSLATLGSITNAPPGILLANIWAESVLQPFSSLIDSDQPHCPILAASEGFSHVVVSATPSKYLEDAQPLFFPTGKLLCNHVAITVTSTTYQAIFFPGICSPPLGLLADA
jgi:hypothetical protein